MPGLPEGSVPEFPFPDKSGFGSGRTLLIGRAIFPSPGGLRRANNRKTRYDLRHALDCSLVVELDRTLPHPARTTRPFGLLLA